MSTLMRAKGEAGTSVHAYRAINSMAVDDENGDCEPPCGGAGHSHERIRDSPKVLNASREE